MIEEIIELPYCLHQAEHWTKMTRGGKSQKDLWQPEDWA